MCTKCQLETSLKLTNKKVYIKLFKYDEEIRNRVTYSQTTCVNFSNIYRNIKDARTYIPKISEYLHYTN